MNNATVLLEAHEHYEKQSYRNRCEILTSNGKLSLSIPLKKKSDKELVSQKEISYAENWQINHWRTITSAYKNSPYFEYFEDEFKVFYTDRFELLFDYNLQLIQLVLKLLKIKKEIKITSEFNQTFSGIDLRTKIHPKNTEEITGVPTSPYHQVFSDKFGFIKNLSIIDLLFNEGLKTANYV